MLNKKIVLILILVSFLSASMVFAEDNSTADDAVSLPDELASVENDNFTLTDSSQYSTSFSALNDLINTSSEDNIYLNQSFTYNDEFDRNLTS